MKILVLNATNQSITAVMSGAAATTNPDVVATYADSTSSAFTEAPQTSALNGTTPVTVVSSPAASTRRIIVGLSIFNRDTAAVTVDINFVDGANTRRLWHGTLQTNEVKNLDGVFDANGAIKTGVSSVPTTSLTGTLQAAQEPAHTGDVTNSAGSLAMTLATVNSNVGSFTLANITVNAKGLITAASTTALPITATMWHDQSDILAGNALLIAANTSQVYNALVFQNPPAQNDAFTQSFWMASGTYTLYILGQTSSDRGRIDWYVDNVSVTTNQDWYSASPTYNVEKSTSITIVGNGVHTIKGIIATKNGSSSGYVMVLNKYWIK